MCVSTCVYLSSLIAIGVTKVCQEKWLKILDNQPTNTDTIHIMSGGQQDKQKKRKQLGPAPIASFEDPLEAANQRV